MAGSSRCKMGSYTIILNLALKNPKYLNVDKAMAAISVSSSLIRAYRSKRKTTVEADIFSVSM